MDIRERRRLRRERRQRLHITSVSIIITLLLTLVLVSTLFAQVNGETPPAGEDQVGEETWDAVDVPSDPPVQDDDRNNQELLPPELSIDKQVDEATARAGETLAYTVVISNGGDSAAQNVVMTDTLPLELTYVEGSLNASGGIWVAATRRLSLPVICPDRYFTRWSVTSF